MRKFWVAGLLVAVFLATPGITAIGEGPINGVRQRTTAEIVADVDARVAAFAAWVEARGTVRRTASLARVNTRLEEIWATRTRPMLEAPGTWRSRPEHLFRKGW